MKIISRQTLPYGCGVHAIANVLDWPGFVSDKRLDESKNGNGIYQLSSYMHEDGYDYDVEPIYCNLLPEYNIPEDYNLHASSELHAFPFLMQVLRKEGGRQHLVGCIGYHDYSVVILDSCESDSILTSWSDIAKRKVYPIISSVFGFADRTNPTGWLIYPLDQIPDFKS